MRRLPWSALQNGSNRSTGTMKTFQRDVGVTWVPARFVLLAVATSVAMGCSGFRSVATSVGLVPLDSASAVAVAQQNVCGAVLSGDTTCVVRGYTHSGGRFQILLDRRPPAGNDRVLVIVRDNGSQIEVAPVDTTLKRPPR
jgi:hypothetical protein